MQASLILLLMRRFSFDSPKILALFAIYFVATLIPLLAMQAEDPTARALLWLYYESKLNLCRWTAGWDGQLIEIIKRARRHPICVWIDLKDVSLFLFHQTVFSFG